MEGQFDERFRQSEAHGCPDVGEAIHDVIMDEAADEGILGWDCTLDHGHHEFGQTADTVVRSARCAVSLIDLRSAASGVQVGLVEAGANAPVVAHQTVEFATVDGAGPPLLNVQSPRGEVDATAEERRRAVITDAPAAADLGLVRASIRKTVWTRFWAL